MSWSDLPKELISIIFQHLTNDIHHLPDLYQCFSVCRSWRFVAKELWHCNAGVARGPWLLLPLEQPNKVVFDTSLYKSHKNTSITFTDTIDSVISYSLPQHPQVNYSDHKIITYASYGGWLLLGHGPAWKKYPAASIHLVFLYNPISRVFIQLPPLPPPHQLTYSTIFVMSQTSPTDPKCIICVLVKLNVLAFCKLADQGCSSSSSSWVLSEKPHRSCIEIKSMIFYHGNFYTIDDDGALYVHTGIIDVVINDNTAWPWPSKENKIALAIGIYNKTHYIKVYLVESINGEVLLVERIFVYRYCNKTASFRVFRLKNLQRSNKNNYNYCWEKTNSLLENEALYIGWYDSISISVNVYDDDHNNNIDTYKPNCIYFLDQKPKGELWFYGMYDLESNNIQRWNFGFIDDYATTEYNFPKFQEAGPYDCRLFTPSIL